MRQCLAHVLFLDDKRRQKTHDIVAGADGQHAVRAQAVHEFRVRHFHLEAQHQAFAAQFFEHARMFGDQSRQLLAEIVGDVAHMFEESLRQHDVEHGVADGHPERIAAESRAVRAHGHAFGRFRRRQTRAHRITGADTLRDRHDVRRHVRPFMGKKLARAADTRLDLVEDEKHAVLVADAAQAAQEFVRHGTDAAFALDRFNQDRRGLLGDGTFDLFQIEMLHLIKTFDLGTETFEIFFLAPGSDGRQRAAVEGAFEGNDVEALRAAGHILIAPRHLDRAFHRLGAGVREEHRVGKGRLNEAARQRFLARHAVEVRGVPEFSGLFRQCTDEFRMGMAERVDGDAGAKIEVSLAVLRKEIRSFAADEGDIRPAVGRQYRRKHGPSPDAGGVGCDKPQSGLYRSLRPIGSSKGPARPVFGAPGGASPGGGSNGAGSLPLCRSACSARRSYFRTSARSSVRYSGRRTHSSTARISAARAL